MVLTHEREGAEETRSEAMGGRMTRGRWKVEGGRWMVDGGWWIAVSRIELDLDRRRDREMHRQAILVTTDPIHSMKHIKPGQYRQYR